MSATLLVPSELMDIETLDNFMLGTTHSLTNTHDIYSLITSLIKENNKKVLVHILQ